MPQIYTGNHEIEVVSGSENCAVLLAPTRGTLRRLIVKQISGTLDGFTFNLYDRLDACSTEEEVSSSFDQINLFDPELHRICPEVTITATNALSELFDVEHGYENQDEQDIRRTPNSRIYLSINASGAGTKIFQITYSIEPIAAV